MSKVTNDGLIVSENSTETKASSLNSSSNKHRSRKMEKLRDMLEKRNFDNLEDELSSSSLDSSNSLSSTLSSNDLFEVDFDSENFDENLSSLSSLSSSSPSDSEDYKKDTQIFSDSQSKRKPYFLLKEKFINEKRKVKKLMDKLRGEKNYIEEEKKIFKYAVDFKKHQIEGKEKEIEKLDEEMKEISRK
jgi:hypothetical protein